MIKIYAVSLFLDMIKKTYYCYIGSEPYNKRNHPGHSSIKAAMVIICRVDPKKMAMEGRFLAIHSNRKLPGKQINHFMSKIKSLIFIVPSLFISKATCVDM
jgi:hypothetical protein